MDRRNIVKSMGALAILGLAAAESVEAAASRRMIARSPDQRLQLELAAGPAGIAWNVRHRGAVILKRSVMKLRLADGRVLGERVRVIGSSRSQRDEVWTPPYGIRREYADHCEQIVLELEDETTGLHFSIVGRAYDEGVAVRYMLGRQGAPLGMLKLAGEETAFRFPAGTRVIASRDEGEYFETAPSELAPAPHPELTASCDQGPLADTPVTVLLPSGAIAVICESDRLHYPRLMLRAAPDARDALVTHLMQFPGRATGYSGPGDTPAEREFSVPLPFATPWRMLIVGERPCDLIERAGLVQALATPSQLGDARWIKPGRAIRSFRDNTTGGGIACVDFAVQRKLEYIEFDAHWYGDGTDPSDATMPVPGLDIEHVARYARERGIGVILYVDRVPAMRQLDAILDRYRAWGIAGIKFGFIWEGRQSDVDFIHDLVRRCAERRLLVNLHDNLRPAGLERTLPNYLALEGVRGNEQFPAARHNVMLAFTRNVSGPIDYTICYGQERNRTTNAHQLALAVVFYSPLAFLYWYDKPAKYATGDWSSIEFFDECPTTWDETRAVAGEIGEFVVVARRHGQRWFLGALSNETARTVQVSLGFLGAGEWLATIFADGEAGESAARTSVEIRRQRVDARASLSLALAPSGGQAIRLERVGQ